MPATFTTAPFGASEPREDRDAALLVDGLGERMHDRTIGRRRRELGEVLGDRATGDGQAVAVQQTRFEQLLHDHGNATHPIEIEHVELAVRLHVGDVRNARTDAIEVVELQVDARLVGDRHEVQHRVGRTAERHDHRDRVLERFLGHDLAGPEIELEQPHHRVAGLVREVIAATIDRGRRRAAGQRHPDRLAHRRHRVRREHARRTNLRSGTPAVRSRPARSR